MKKIFTNLFLLATLLFASTNLNAQTYIINDGGSYDVMTGLASSKTKTFTISNPRPCDMLTFSYSKQTGATGGVTVTATYSDNSTQEIISKGSSSSQSYNFSRKKVKELSFKGTGTLKKTISNIKLTMSSYADAPTATSWNPTAVIGSADETASTTMAWCNTSAFALSLSGDGASQFTYSISNNASAGNYGTATITATYKHNVAGTHKATLTITTAFGSHKIELTGTTNKKAQTIAWAEALSGSDIALPIGKIITPPATAKTAITYNIEDPTIISIDENTLTALKAGTTTITATAKDNEEWLSADSTITVKVTEKKVQYIHWNDNLTRLKVGGDSVLLTATAWVLIDPKTETQEENTERTPLITYASANNNIVSVSGNVLTIVGEGETILTATLPGDDLYEGVVVSTPVHVRAASTSVCEAYVLDDSKTRTLNTIDDEEYIINGPADKLTFTANREKLLGFSDGNLKVDQYYNGGWHNIFDQGLSLNDYTQYASIQLNRNATKLKFYTETGATGYKNIKDVAVTMATYLETSTPEIVVERSIIGSIIEKTIRIQYSNLPDDVPVVNNSDKVTVKESGLGNVCGEYGEKELHLTIRPTEIGVIEDVITIHDEATGKKLEIPVVVHTQRNTQTITWEQDLANIYTTDTLTLNAKAKTEVYYTSSDSTIAYAEGKVLKINKHGQFTLTAVAPQDETYEQATVSKEITINTVRPTVSAWPTVEPIAYAQPLTTDMLEGGEAEVEGDFVWNTELNQTLVPNTYDLAVRFIPTNANYYAPVDGTVAVTINKSAQSIDWNDSFENITVADSIALTASAKTQVTYEVSDTELAYITENNVLYFTRGGVVSITAYASEDDYYLATETVRELTILPAIPNILDKPTATAITYGQTIGESLLEGGEASVLGTFNWLDSLAMPNAGTYWQYVRFTPDDQESFKPVDFQVEVHVDTASQTITWELTNFVMKVGDVLNLTAVATSGLEVTYTLDDDTYAEINNNVLTALQVGTVTVTASQDGTYVDEFGDEYTNYFAAEPVSYDITIVAKDVNTGTDLTFPEVKATKIIRDGRLYIIRNGHIYNVNGQVVE